MSVPVLKVSVTNPQGFFDLSNFYLIKLISEPLTLRPLCCSRLRSNEKCLVDQLLLSQDLLKNIFNSKTFLNWRPLVCTISLTVHVVPLVTPASFHVLVVMYTWVPFAMSVELWSPPAVVGSACLAPFTNQNWCHIPNLGNIFNKTYLTKGKNHRLINSYFRIMVWEKGSLLNQSKDVPNNAIKTLTVFSY